MGIRTTTAAVVLALGAGCGGGSSASPETFWDDVEAAVNGFDADLDEIDAEYLGRSWDVPDEPADRAEFIWQTDLEIQGEYLDAWRDYVDRLKGLDPPEGYPEAGGEYANGLPEYFEEAIIENEEAALAAMELRWTLWNDVSDPLKALTGGRELPEAERRRLDEATKVLIDTENTLEDEWDWFEDSAEEVGHPIDETVDLRTDFDMGFLPLRAGALAGDIISNADES